MKRISLCLLFYLFILIPLCATDYYVSTTGSDSNTGTSADAPFATIGKAAQMAKAGDIIYIAGGTYSEMSIRPATSGSQTAGYITFRPLSDSDKVVITKTDNTTDDASNHIFNLSNRSYIWIEGIQFKDMQYHAACIYMGSSAHCVITGCTFSNLGQEAVTTTAGSTAMVYLSNSTWCTVQNNYFNNIFGDGVSYSGSSSSHLLICRNTFTGLKGKKRSWASDDYKYSSAINGTASSGNTNGPNLICQNYISGGQDGIWIDVGCSGNILTRNWGDGGQRLVFAESRCDGNWIQENIALNMSESGYRSALYSETDWTCNTRWLHNVAYQCAKGFYIDKSKYNEIRGNIAYECSAYSLQFTANAVAEGNNVFSRNLWHASSVNKTMHYDGTAMTAADFATAAGETDGIYDQSPLFTSTTSPYAFTLQANSPCKRAGEGGIDMGAYAVYAPQTYGWDGSYAHRDVQVGFDELITEGERGETYTLTLRMAKAATETVTVSIAPVGGELVQGTDFTLSATEVTFAAGETVKPLYISFIGSPAAYNQLLLLQVSPASGTFSTRSYTAFKLITQGGDEYELSKDKIVITTTIDGSASTTTPFEWQANNQSNQLANVWNKLGQSVSGGVVFGYASNNSLGNGYMDWNGYDRVVVSYSSVSGSTPKIRFLAKNSNGGDATVEQSLTTGTTSSTTYISAIAQGKCTSVKCGGTVTATQIELIKSFRALSSTAFSIAPSISSAVSYDRTFTIGETSTICLPFALTAAEATAAGAFYTLSAIAGDVLTFSKVDVPAAYTPYLFVPATETPFANLTDKAIDSPIGHTCQTTVGDYSLKGTLACDADMVSSNSGKTCYGWDAANGTFGRAVSGAHIPAFRAYITVSGGASSAPSMLKAIFGDKNGTTGISENVNREEIKDNVYYDLSGRRVENPTKGLYIKNGKKIFIR